MLITLNQPNATDKAFARYPVAISTSDNPSRTIVMYPVSGNEANTSGTPFESVSELLEGPTAIAVSKDDATAPARILAENGKTMQSLEIKGGVVENTFYDAAAMEKIASIPSREILLGRLFGSMQSPVANLARVINQIAESKGDAA